ncbi:MAG: S-layer homology domain-containing protein, partial [Cyanobacteria bacterium J083]
RTVESWFKPDPSLEEKQSDKSKEKINSDNKPQENTSEELPPEFPAAIPLYQSAKLVKIEPGINKSQGKTIWETAATQREIKQFYQDWFAANNWEIQAPDSQSKPLSGQTKELDVLKATKDNLAVTLSWLENEDNSQTGKFALAYQNKLEPNTSTKEPKDKVNVVKNSTKLDLVNLEQVSEQIRPYIQDLVALNILTTTSSAGEQLTSIDASKPISRRDFARWLVMINNTYYANSPGKQIRLASKNSPPAFIDIKPQDPDFPYIQGLAEAGIIPSPLTGDTTANLFRPEAPLTRENLIFWKVPLDNRRALPKASIEQVKEVWGFQDIAQVNPKILPSLYADYQNGEQSNIRRVFGYTTLLQPKKAVTYAEAAAALWYLGYQGEGVNAQEILQAKNQ